MKDVLHSTDPLAVARAIDLLQAEGIPCFELDRHMSVLEGSIGVLPRRVSVADRDYAAASDLLRAHGIG